MTWKIYYISNDRAQVCCGVHTTNFEYVAKLIIKAGDDMGFEVRVETEE